MATAIASGPEGGGSKSIRAHYPGPSVAGWAGRCITVSPMIAFGIAVASRAKFRSRALPGIRRAREADSLVLTREHGSLQAAYNSILDEAAARPELEALVLLHEDVEIVDPEFVTKLQRRIAEPDVAVVGVVGARGVRSLAWWEGDAFGGVAAPALIRAGRIDFPGGAPQDVDVVDGLLMALSPWAVRELRFDEAFAEDFHGYDVDFCFQARALGRRVIVDDIAVAHYSEWAPARYGEAWVRAAVTLKRKWGASWVPGRGNRSFAPQAPTHAGSPPASDVDDRRSPTSRSERSQPPVHDDAISPRTWSGSSRSDVPGPRGLPR